MIHCERFYVVFFDIDPLISIDISYTNEDHMFEWQDVGKPLKTRDFETAGMTQRMPVVARVFVLWLRIDHVRMGINPYNSKIFEYSFKCVNCSTANRVISSNRNHNTIFIILKRRNNFIVDFFQHMIQQCQITKIMLILLLIFVFDLTTICINIAKINCFNTVFGFDNWW